MKRKGKAEVRINGAVVTEKQLGELESTYGIRPVSGDYWYDDRSGLYGVTGQPSAGFMLAGHEFAELSPEASGGDTGIFINGRELPQVEWILLGQMLGSPVLPGSYWLDQHGNAGYEGNPYPVINMLMAAQQGAGGGGGNIWSTRFCSGNYDPVSGQGYVNVPGHGPIGFGMD